MEPTFENCLATHDSEETLSSQRGSSSEKGGQAEKGPDFEASYKYRVWRNSNQMPSDQERTEHTPRPCLHEESGVTENNEPGGQQITQVPLRAVLRETVRTTARQRTEVSKSAQGAKTNGHSS